MYEYTATIADVHDGDTITVDIDLGFNLWTKKLKVRLYGLNCPELNTPAGKEARDFAQRMMPLGSSITLRTYKDKQEKYGRYLATVVFPDGSTFNRMLIDSGRAKEWYGQGERPV